MEWISGNILRVSALAKNTRLQNLPDYRLLRRESTRSAHADLQRYWTKLANNMEAGAYIGIFGKLFRLIRRASGKQLTP